jgi:hypothetical protein
VQIPSLSKVDADIRQEAAVRAKEVRPHNKGSALVLETKGFVSSLIRGIVTGMTLVDRSAAPTKIFESSEPAASWIAPYLGAGDRKPISGREVLEVFESLRRDTTPVGSLRP